MKVLLSPELLVLCPGRNPALNIKDPVEEVMG